jgi:hypothetical protein
MEPENRDMDWYTENRRLSGRGFEKWAHKRLRTVLPREEVKTIIGSIGDAEAVSQ